MSSADIRTAILAAGAIALACPHRRRPGRLHSAEMIELLSPATFTVGSHGPVYPEHAADVTLDDTQHWLADAIVCRRCDQVDLRYCDAVTLVAFSDPGAAGSAAASTTAHPGAQP